MRYSYEFKKKCVEMYHQGKYPDTPESISTEVFRKKLENGFGLKNHAVLTLYAIRHIIKIGPRKKNLNLLLK